MGKVACCQHWWGMTIGLRDVNQLAECEIKRKMKRWMIWLLSLAKGIPFSLYLSFLFFSLLLSVKPETASEMSIINWTVMLFYKYLCSFWKRYSCMLFYSCSVIIICSSFSFLLFFASSLLVSSFRPYRSQKRKESIILIPVVFLYIYLSLPRSSLLSQPKILPASVHIHIYQSEEVRVLAHRFFFSSCIGQI